MKKWTFNIIALFLVLNTAWVYAQVEKTKKISKSYPVNGNSALNIENKFGKVHINTNNGNTIKVDVTMIGRANSDAKAQGILDKLQVKVLEGNEISFRTSVISGIRSTRRMKRNSSRSFEVNYLISIPKTMKLRVRNRYGNVFLGDYSGELDMYVAYGSIKAGKIINPQDKKIKVAFGTLDIDNIDRGELNVTYGTLKLDNARQVQLTNNFSSVDINRIKTLDLKSKYGKLKVATVDNISGSSKFDRLNIGLLNNNCKLVMTYAKGFAIDKVNKNFQKIDVDGKFSAMEFNFENGASFDYELNAQFAKIKALLLQKNQIRKHIERSNSSYYSGKLGNGKSKVTIKSKYGTVRIK